MTTPAYRALANTLADRIRAGEYPIGSRLPSITELARWPEITQGIARDALDLLGAEGWIEVRQGARSTVVRVPPAPPTPDEPWVEWRSSLEERLAEVERRLDRIEGKPSAVRPDPDDS